MPKIQFVDEGDEVIGSGTKEKALQHGIIHRVVRVFLYNSKGGLLIQKRAKNLASYPGRWDHSAAGHVDEGETYLEAAVREMREEIGVGGVTLKEWGKLYTEEVEGGHIKKRFNMIYTGSYDGEVQIDGEEVAEVKWVDPSELEQWMREKPDEFPPGFVKSFEHLRAHGDGKGQSSPS